MYAFQYHAPGTIAHAEKLLAVTPSGKLLAGGMSLVPALRHRLLRVPDLIDLNNIPGLSGIEINERTVRIGAMTRHAAVAASADLTKSLPGLAALAGGIGDVQVRNRGTLGGSLANNDPAADYPAALLGLDGVVVTTKRSIAAGHFIRGMFETALESDEIIRYVEFPRPQAAAYVKFANDSSRFSIVGVFVARSADGVRVAVTGAGPCAFRMSEFEEALQRDFNPRVLEKSTVDPSRLVSDIHASASYRAHLVRVVAQTAVEQAK
jgi:carbon-monoxide dehydrogenase medium subunit